MTTLSYCLKFCREEIKFCRSAEEIEFCREEIKFCQARTQLFRRGGRVHFKLERALCQIYISV